MPSVPVVSFLSDFGTGDGYVGVCHAVLCRLAPHARVIDLSHDVPPGDVRAGALLLARGVRWFPVATHLAVVDPGVGTARRGVAVATARGDVLVGPDNGLLGRAADVLGGVAGAWELVSPRYRLEPVSATFHGRDVFAPAAAALAGGAEPSLLGPLASDLVRLDLRAPLVERGRIVAEVGLVDRFGNVGLLASEADLTAALGDDPGGRVAVLTGSARSAARRVRTFGDLGPGELGVHVDSDGQVALTVRDAPVASLLPAEACQPGATIELATK